MAADITRKRMHRLIVKCAVFVGFALATSVVPAKDVAADALLKNVTAEVVVLLRAHSEHVDTPRTSELNEHVQRKILPLFHFRRMAQMAVGPAWRDATPDQRNALTAEFKTLLVRTYATALREFRDHMIEFKPLKAAPGAQEAIVQSVVKQGDAAPVPIDYYMEKTPAGWKVYEINIDGMNLIENYRPTFAARVRDLGFDGLIKALSDRNSPE